MSKNLKIIQHKDGTRPLWNWKLYFLGGDKRMKTNQDWIKLTNAIKDALHEMEKCPDDSVQDIWNEQLKSWETGLKMNHHYEIVREGEFL